MSEIRSVSVHLDADVASYIAKMKLAGKATDDAFSSGSRSIDLTNSKLSTTESTLGKVDAQTKKVTASTKSLGTEVDKTSRKVDNGAKSIDKFSGRLGLMISGLTAIGPATVPIAAELIPLLTTATADVGFLAAGVGVGVLAFHGLGTALTAFNKAALAPTAANVAAAQLAMDKLPPSARAFVRELHGLNPELDKLRQSAGSGLFPGLTSGLEHAVTVGPLAQRTIHGIAVEMGSLANDAGKAVSGPEGRAFLRYFGHQTPLALHQLGDAAGYGADGVFHLVKAFTPLTHDVNSGILNLAKSFDAWATSLGKTKDFQSFLQYIQTNEPQVIALLGNTRDLFVDLVKAAAPLGGPTLQTLNLILKVLDAIASSPLGTPLLALAQVNAILKLTSRGLAAVGAESRIGLGGITTSAEKGSGALKGLRADITATGTALRTIGGNVGKNASGGTPLLQGVNKEGVANIGKTAVQAAALGVILTGTDQKLGLTNTTTLALAGSMSGPLGAALGATAGLFLDSKAASDGYRQSLSSLTDQINVAAAQGNQDQVDKLTKQGLNQNQSALSKFGDVFHGGIKGLTTGGIPGLFSGQFDAINHLDDAQNKFADDAQAASAKAAKAYSHLSDSQLLTAQAAGKFGLAEQKAAQRTLASRDAAQAVATQFIGLGKDVDNTKISLDQWIHQLQQQARALTNFGNNAKAAADKGLKNGLIAELQAAGPAGALRMQQLANSSQSEIGKANRAWAAGQRAIENYTRAISGVPPAKLQVNTSPALANLRVLQYQIDHLHGNTVIVRTTGGHVPGEPNADGGLIRGPGGPRSDRIPALLSNGEFVVNAAATARNLSTLYSMNARRFADGGLATHVTSTPASAYMSDGSGGGVAGASVGVRVELHRLRASLADATKTLDQERKARQALIQQRQQVASTIRDSLRSQILGVTPSSIWSDAGATNPLGILRGDIHQARQFRSTIAQLRRRGLSGAVVGQITDLADAQQLASLSQHQLNQLGPLFRERERLTRAASGAAGNLAFGKQIAEQTKVIHAQAADVRRLTHQQAEANRRLAAIEKAAKAAPAATGAAVAKGINKPAAAAVRRHR